ncbi:D-glycero-beta-D-manno-heptose 1-phosphate adenylyltransferase [Ferruginibacter lapsinanis]|uniref:D-glycero-beta-D-manno-heptose 1-phosphate adenylyltransferase n=1 Tax=Ferruginibacter lapsinanis TaxID=563172 RepID=UPI001E57565C|nr:D-glycero-beta-D-manno-heptose 1-phosphate adenylyltransferase [Ferruginibacter lapsinanis]UEG49256.1 D-glycero-beta-D-manno-heptose 1-phosphate adenylyltransferase [Ferruginibacter lapsinanis]
MRNSKSITDKIITTAELPHLVNRWRLLGKKIVFTNGVFDILHEGHIASLSEAASFGDILVVGVNTDASVKRLKGESRPINNESARSLLLASIVLTDTIILFDEDTPLNLIKTILPDVLVKGGDYSIDQIVGAKEVIANGGEVKIVELVPGISTTAIIKKMASS